MDAKKILNSLFWVAMISSLVCGKAYFDNRYYFTRYVGLQDQILVATCSAVVFIILVLIRRNTSLSSAGFPRLASIAIGDYTFSKYLTINICSLFYAVSQGIALGFFAQQVSFCLYLLPTHGVDYSMLPAALPILLAPLYVLLVRIAIEGYIVFFSAAQNIQKFIDHSVVER